MLYEVERLKSFKCVQFRSWILMQNLYIQSKTRFF